MPWPLNCSRKCYSQCSKTKWWTWRHPWTTSTIDTPGHEVGPPISQITPSHQQNKGECSKETTTKILLSLKEKRLKCNGHWQIDIWQKNPTDEIRTVLQMQEDWTTSKQMPWGDRRQRKKKRGTEQENKNKRILYSCPCNFQRLRWGGEGQVSWRSTECGFLERELNQCQYPLVLTFTL